MTASVARPGNEAVVSSFEFIERNHAHYPIALMCRVLQVSRSGYYAWRGRPPSERARQDGKLKDRLLRLHTESKGTYGSPRLTASLRRHGISIGQRRVRRLMAEQGLKGQCRRRWVKTTRRAKKGRPAPDLVERRYEAKEPIRLWVSDITYIPTQTGFLFLAVVLDVFSRKVVGWAISTHMRTELVIRALDMAIQRRRPEGVIHHSDQGSQYTSAEFKGRCAEAGVAVSMGSVGDCYDNAMAESFFATLECELLWLKPLSGPSQAREEVFNFIEGWYNTRRLHSALGYCAPVDYELQNAA